jgi:hypothetical protein
VFGRTTKTQALKDNAVNTAELTAALVKDRKFRKQVASAVAHATVARRRAKRQLGLAGAVRRINADPRIRREFQAMVDSLDKAFARFEKKRSHKLRNSLIVVAGVGAGAAAVAARK